MQLINISRNTILSENLKQAKTLVDKTFGLHIKQNPRSLLLKTRFGVHTFFLKGKIDIIVLNSSSKVVKAKTVSPNTVFIYNPLYSYVLELPFKTIKKSKTRVGDQLFLNNHSFKDITL